MSNLFVKMLTFVMFALCTCTLCFGEGVVSSCSLIDPAVMTSLSSSPLESHDLVTLTLSLPAPGTLTPSPLVSLVAAAMGPSFVLMRSGEGEMGGETGGSRVAAF